MHFTHTHTQTETNKQTLLSSKQINQKQQQQQQKTGKYKPDELVIFLKINNKKNLQIEKTG